VPRAAPLPDYPTFQLLTGARTYADVLALAERGDASRVDKVVGDIYGRDGCRDLGLPADLTAANFGKMAAADSDTQPPAEADLARATLTMVAQATSVLVQSLKRPGEPVMIAGGFIDTNPVARAVFAGSLARLGGRAVFCRHSAFLGCLGSLRRGMGGTTPSRPVPDSHALAFNQGMRWAALRHFDRAMECFTNVGGLAGHWGLAWISARQLWRAEKQQRRRRRLSHRQTPEEGDQQAKQCAGWWRTGLRASRQARDLLGGSDSPAAGAGGGGAWSGGVQTSTGVRSDYQLLVNATTLLFSDVRTPTSRFLAAAFLSALREGVGGDAPGIVDDWTRLVWSVLVQSLVDQEDEDIVSEEEVGRWVREGTRRWPDEPGIWAAALVHAERVGNASTASTAKDHVLRYCRDLADLLITPHSQREGQAKGHAVQSHCPNWSVGPADKEISRFAKPLTEARLPGVDDVVLELLVADAQEDSDLGQQDGAVG